MKVRITIELDIAYSKQEHENTLYFAGVIDGLLEHEINKDCPLNDTYKHISYRGVVGLSAVDE